MIHFAIVLVLVSIAVEFTSSVAIYRDTGVFKKSQHRGGKQLNALSSYDNEEYPMSHVNPFMESARWESAEWPREFGGGRPGGENTYESEDRPYNWFYYNKYLTNGRFNHLYNGPHNDDHAGIGQPSKHSPPHLLPQPAPSFRKLQLFQG